MKIYDEKEGFKLLHESGLLFEINRTILHPVGLSFGINIDKEGEIEGVKILEAREDVDMHKLVFSVERLEKGEEKLREFISVKGVLASEWRLKVLGEVRQELKSGKEGIEYLLHRHVKDPSPKIGPAPSPEAVAKDREMAELIEKTKYIPIFVPPVSNKLNVTVDTEAETTEEEIAETREDAIDRKLSKKYGGRPHKGPQGIECKSDRVTKASVPGGGSIILCLDCGYIHSDSDLIKD